MLDTLTEILNANKTYVESFGEKGKLNSPPQKQMAILTCMDARLDPAKFAGFSEGDVHVIRNAGGRASDDAIRSLVISHKMLGTKFWFVIQHTKCGMQGATNDGIAQLLEESLETIQIDENSALNEKRDSGSAEGYKVDWLPIDNLEESVKNDVFRIRNHPLVSDTISIYGLIYDVESGCLKQVDGAISMAK
ncbi:carbonic anhydrase [Prolixibacteraceae bacterium JC049]|nr:carbonic anhydrase [Prolixibacteraceae bacterium JC049]